LISANGRKRMIPIMREQEVPVERVVATSRK